MCTKYMELQPDRNLLESSFEGYKLSLHPASTNKYVLDNPISRVLIDANQYFLLHAKIFGLNNFLTGETDTEFENVYFVDNEIHLKKASCNSNKLNICNLWTVPIKIDVKSDAPKNDLYNVSFKLISKSLAVLGNGQGSFFILDTGDRCTDNEWQLLYEEELWDGKGFYIQDAVLKESDLHVILCTIEPGDKKAQLSIKWVKLTNRNCTWEKSSCKQLLVQGDISYLYLERTCEAVYVASTSGCKFIFDSENPVVENTTSSIASEKYQWSQDADDVVIHFILAEDIRKEDVTVTSGSINVKVEYKGVSLLNGALFNKVENDMTTISVSKNLLEITFVKKDQGLTWSDLLKSSKDVSSDEFCIGREVKEKLHSASEKEGDPQQGLTFNTEAVEECDFSNEEFTVFERICVKTHQVTHKYSFGSNQVLLTVQMDEDRPPSIGVRYDVDICIWQPQFEDSNFKLKHVATLLAMGYIQASKQQKKFISCPFDTSVSLICETSRHLFVYRQKSRIPSGELRNRKSGARIESVAEQQVISIPNEEIFGIYSSPSAIYLLGEQFLLHIKT